MRSIRGQKQRRLLTPTERDGIRREIGEIENDRAGIMEGVPHRFLGGIDQDVKGDERLLDKRQKRLQSVLDVGTPEPIARSERVALETEEKRLRDSLQSRMITRKMMQLRPGTMEFTKARNALAKQEMSAEFSRDAASWKNIRRRLDPEDPDVSNLEQLRPE